MQLELLTGWDGRVCACCLCVFPCPRCCVWIVVFREWKNFEQCRSFFLYCTCNMSNIWMVLWAALLAQVPVSSDFPFKWSPIFLPSWQYNCRWWYNFLMHCSEMDQFKYGCCCYSIWLSMCQHTLSRKDWYCLVFTALNCFFELEYLSCTSFIWLLLMKSWNGGG